MAAARALVTCGVILCVLVAGCGGTSLSSQVGQLTAAHDIRCDKEGWMVFVGERQKVYGCTGTYESGANHAHCYVVVDGNAQDVTSDLANSAEGWSCASERQDALRQLDAARTALLTAKAKLSSTYAKRAADPYYKDAEPGSLDRRYWAYEVQRYKRAVTDATASLSQANRVLAETSG